MNLKKKSHFCLHSRLMWAISLCHNSDRLQTNRFVYNYQIINRRCLHIMSLSPQKIQGSSKDCVCVSYICDSSCGILMSNKTTTVAHTGWSSTHHRLLLKKNSPSAICDWRPPLEKSCRKSLNPRPSHASRNRRYWKTNTRFTHNSHLHCCNTPLVFTAEMRRQPERLIWPDLVYR